MSAETGHRLERGPTHASSSTRRGIIDFTAPVERSPTTTAETGPVRVGIYDDATRLVAKL